MISPKPPTFEGEGVRHKGLLAHLVADYDRYRLITGPLLIALTWFSVSLSLDLSWPLPPPPKSKAELVSVSGVYEQVPRQGRYSRAKDFIVTAEGKRRIRCSSGLTARCLDGRYDGQQISAYVSEADTSFVFEIRDENQKPLRSFEKQVEIVLRDSESIRHDKQNLTLSLAIAALLTGLSIVSRPYRKQL